MPKRVIDFDAMWGSDKLASCADWAQAEYAWLYGLADASGCFEITNLRVIWGRVAAVRGNFTIERLEQVFLEFQDKGLLFVWAHEGKRYAHWTGSDVPGRLPPPSWRMRLEKFAPPVPKKEFAEYMAGFARGRAAMAGTFRAESAEKCDRNLKFEISDLKQKSGEVTFVSESGLKRGVEEDQAQDWGLNLNLDLKGNGKRVLERGAAADDSEQNANLREAREIEITNRETIKNKNPFFYNSNASAGAKGFSNANSIANSTTDSNALTNASRTGNAGARLNLNLNANSNTNTLTGLKANSNVRANGLETGEANSIERAGGQADLRSTSDANSGIEANSGARFGAREYEFKSAEAYRKSARDIALERDLRVGTGPAIGPARVRPEVLERIRLREEARAKAGTG